MRRAMFFAALLGWLLAGVSTVGAQDAGLLDESEEQAMTDTIQYALEMNRTNQASDWVNPDTGRSGAVVPVKTFENAQGQPCREFITAIIIGGREEQGYGTACRQPDGSWQIVSDDRQSVPAPPPPPREVYRYPPPPVYYSYPVGFYGPAPIYLSFSYVYRSGWAYRGTRYLDGPAFWRRYPIHVRERVFVGPRVYDHYRWRESWERRGREEQRNRDFRGPSWGNPDRSRGGRNRERR